MKLNIVSIFKLCILYCRKCEGVSKNEGCKRTSYFPFLELLVPNLLIVKVVILLIINCSNCAFFFENKKEFLVLNQLCFLLIVYLLISTIWPSFTMWDIRSYLRDLWALFSFAFRLIILITWFIWKILWILASKFLKNNR